MSVVGCSFALNWIPWIIAVSWFPFLPIQYVVERLVTVRASVSVWSVNENIGVLFLWLSLFWCSPISLWRLWLPCFLPSFPYPVNQWTSYQSLSHATVTVAPFRAKLQNKTYKKWGSHCVLIVFPKSCLCSQICLSYFDFLNPQELC